MLSPRRDLQAALTPRRTLILPMLIILAPLLWFVYRGATAPQQDIVTIELAARTVLITVSGSIVVSYILGAAVATWLTDTIKPTRPLVGNLAHPRTGVLALVTTVGVAMVVYLVAIQIIEFPGWVTPILEPLGLLVALPLAIIYSGTIVVGSGLAVDAFTLEAIAVAVGVSSSVVWVFLLAIGATVLLDTARSAVNHR